MIISYSQFRSRVSDNTSNIRWDKSKELIMALASAEIMPRTTRRKVLDFQAIGDTKIFSLARKITYPPALFPDGKYDSDAPL